MNKTDLSKFNNDWYNPGSKSKRAVWFFFNALIMQNRFFPFSGLKINLLLLFGAEIGEGVVLKPNINIKYPWKLTIGNNVWIGEEVWIDNLGEVMIGDNACISQGAMLLCGNHHYKKIAFDLIVGDITIEEGAWIGAKSVVCPGVKCKSHSILAVNSVATHNLDAYTIYQGNPAKAIRKREIRDKE